MHHPVICFTLAIEYKAQFGNLYIEMFQGKVKLWLWLVREKGRVQHRKLSARLVLEKADKQFCLKTGCWAGENRAPTIQSSHSAANSLIDGFGLTVEHFEWLVQLINNSASQYTSGMGLSQVEMWLKKCRTLCVPFLIELSPYQ